MSGDKKMRDQLKQANPDKQWAKQVDKMTPSQVAEVYARLQSQKKL